MQPTPCALTCQGTLCGCTRRTRPVQQMLQHYLECKAKDPEHTSMCVVLPLWAEAKWNKYIENMQIIKEYPVGTQMFTVPDGLAARKALPGVPWPVRVYYDAPAKPGAVSQPTLASSGPVAMRLIAGEKGIAAPDSHASHYFVHKDFAKRNGITVTGSDTQVQLANSVYYCWYLHSQAKVGQPSKDPRNQSFRPRCPYTWCRPHIGAGLASQEQSKARL